MRSLQSRKAIFLFVRLSPLIQSVAQNTGMHVHLATCATAATDMYNIRQIQSRNIRTLSNSRSPRIVHFFVGNKRLNFDSGEFFDNLRNKRKSSVFSETNLDSCGPRKPLLDDTSYLP